MIHNVVDFRAIKAADVMLPLANVRTISSSASVEELIGRSRHANIDRWPITGDSGDITGLVNVLDVALEGKQRTVAESYQRRIVKVNADEPAYSIVRKLRAARVTLAVVLDTAGKQIGVVAWEDRQSAAWSPSPWRSIGGPKACKQTSPGQASLRAPL